MTTGGVHFVPLKPYRLPNGLYVTGAGLAKDIEAREGDRGEALMYVPSAGRRCEVLEWYPD